VTHDQIKEKILLLRDGEIPEAEKALLEKHLLACSDCSALQVDLDVLGGAFSAEPLPEPSEDFVRAVMADIREEESSRNDYGVELPFRWWAPAFAAGLAAVVTLIAAPEMRAAVTVETLLTVGAGIPLDETVDAEETEVPEILAVSAEDL
jgi:anti-sigma factor RsiW